MKLSAALIVASLLSAAHAFVIGGSSSITRHGGITFPLAMAANTVFEGKPTERAMNMDIRQEVRKSSFLDVNGNSLTIDELIGEPSQDSGVSVVVFLRSLGWPLCQEHILQYSKRRNELLESGVKLVMISIGKPQVGECSVMMGHACRLTVRQEWVRQLTTSSFL